MRQICKPFWINYVLPLASADCTWGNNPKADVGFEDGDFGVGEVGVAFVGVGTPDSDSDGATIGGRGCREVGVYWGIAGDADADAGVEGEGVGKGATALDNIS